MADSPGKRLALFRAARGLSQRDLAVALGVSPAAVGLIENDSRTPSKNFLLKISDRYMVSSDWLLHGAGEPPDTSKPSHGDFRFKGEEFAMIRRMDLSVSAGPGIEPVEGGDAEALAFSRQWLIRNHINSDLAVLVRVKGDSMAPAIPDGCLVMIHLPEANLEREGVYAFNREGASYVKRLVPAGRNERGHITAITILSDNPAYPPLVVFGEALEELRVVGRVRCVLTTL
jgi:phage repressor protein C with HTH and peptisase S24 domain